MYIRLALSSTFLLFGLSLQVSKKNFRIFAKKIRIRPREILIEIFSLNHFFLHPGGARAPGPVGSFKTQSKFPGRCYRSIISHLALNYFGCHFKCPKKNFFCPRSDFWHNANQGSALRPPKRDMPKDSPEWVESVKNKFGKIRKSNPDEIRLGAKNDIMFRAKKVFFRAIKIYSKK
jgi:hypothetical protein